MIEEPSFKEFTIPFNNGTTPLETFFVGAPVILYVLLSNLVTSLLCTRLTINKPCRFIAEFFFILIPSIITICIPSTPITVTHIVLTISLAVFIRQLNITHPQKDSETKFKSYITNVRASSNIVTIISILAVDFEIFPKRFAKTDVYGFSFMDFGVGLFILSNGIVAPEIRGVPDSVSKSLKSSAVLLFLGVARWFFTSRLNYNVPVSEYGVHWNFFVTLGVTKLLTTFILNVINVKYIIINAITLLISYEIILESGLKDFVFKETDRINFLDANKEGISSILGFVSLYLFTVYFMYRLNKIAKDRAKTICALLATCFFCLTISLTLHSYFPISRRLANSAYCVWMLFIGISKLSLYYFVETIIEKVCNRRLGNIIYSPLIFEAVNYNGLLFFLIGNVLTGLVNFSIDPSNIKNDVALFILIGYMFLNCLVACILYHRKIRLNV